MAYVPSHAADVFISYCHEDDVAWIEKFENDLERALRRKLRARTRPEIFFDAKKLRAGRQIDEDIPACLEATGFFVALVSQRYNSSTYCKQKELTKFLRCAPESDRVIQVWLDPDEPLPVPGAKAVAFADSKRLFRPGTNKYDNALQSVYEPIVSKLDRLYADSKMIFLAWSDDRELRNERERLRPEIEGRGLRIYPKEIGEYEEEIRLRDALQKSSASVHFFGATAEKFAEQQLRVAVQVGRPCVVASRNREETRRGPAGSPAPVYLEQGNPTIAIANAIDAVLGRGKRDDPDPQATLGKTGLFLVFKPDSDSTLGIRVRQRIVTRGPFEVIEPVRSAAAESRYDQLPRAKAAVLCCGKADRKWFLDEFEALNTAIAMRQLCELRRVLLLTSPEGKNGFELEEQDRLLRSVEELDGFLRELQGAGA
ncbi:MAG: toll/interleukin-1 receptor domain-containing protein [Planctomycetota bacterium]